MLGQVFSIYNTKSKSLILQLNKIKGYDKNYNSVTSKYKC